eukprot:762972-Hanusia_phi.AAC.3
MHVSRPHHQVYLPQLLALSDLTVQPCKVPAMLSTLLFGQRLCMHVKTESSTSHLAFLNLCSSIVVNKLHAYLSHRAHTQCAAATPPVA